MALLMPSCTKDTGGLNNNTNDSIVGGGTIVDGSMLTFQFLYNMIGRTDKSEITNQFVSAGYSVAANGNDLLKFEKGEFSIIFAFNDDDQNQVYYVTCEKEYNSMEIDTLAHDELLYILRDELTFSNRFQITYYSGDLNSAENFDTKDLLIEALSNRSFSSVEDVTSWSDYSNGVTTDIDFDRDDKALLYFIKKQ